MTQTDFRCHGSLHIAAAAVLLLCLCVASHAGARAGISFPARYDQSTVQTLIENIEVGHNATILKIGYFGRRAGEDFAVRDGYALLRDAANAAKPGSRRWVLLQGIVAFAAFHVPYLPADDGFAAYDAVFDTSVDYDTDALPALHATVMEYLVVLLVRLRNEGQVTGDDPRKTLLLAWKAYATCIDGGVPDTSVYPWAEAAQACALEGQIKAAMLARASTPARRETYSIFRAMVILDDGKDAAAEVRWLRRAQSVVPAGKLLQYSYYAELAQTEEGAGNFKGAVADMRTCAQRTGCGYGLLLPLLVRTGDASARDVAAVLERPGASAAEVNLAASGLDSLFKENKTKYRAAFDIAVAVLTSYIKNEGALTSDPTVHARLTLAMLYIEANARSQAAALATGDFDQSALTPTGKADLATLRFITASAESAAKQK